MHHPLRPRRPLAAAAGLTLAAMLALSACGASDGEAAQNAGGSAASDAGGQAADEQSWPRTVAVGDGEVELAEEPQRIAVLSSDLASIVLPLTGGDRVVAAPGSLSENTSVADEMAQVENPLPAGATTDPEQIMSTEPDLVLISARHDSEREAIELLEGFDVPVAAFDGSAWSGTEDVIEQIGVVGELVGAEEEGEEFASELETRRAEAVARGEDGDAPRTLGIWSHSNEQMIASPTLMMTGLIREAGGAAVVDEIDVDGQIPADPEFIVEQAPEVIIVQVSSESGEDSFAELLESPALADVPAIANDRMHYVSSEITSSSAGLQLVDGLEEISRALHEQE
ncbi:MAG: ABC transporter substrate-binding protein [Brachybacterium sp.]